MHWCILKHFLVLNCLGGTSSIIHHRFAITGASLWFWHYVEVVNAFYYCLSQFLLQIFCHSCVMPAGVFSALNTEVEICTLVLWWTLKKKSRYLVAVRDTHAHLKTAKGKNCCQSFVHTVRNISVWPIVTKMTTSVINWKRPSLAWLPHKRSCRRL